MVSKIPPRLIDDIKRGACVAFLGAGLSIPAGMPSWVKFLEDMILEGESMHLIKDAKALQKELGLGRFLEVSEYVRQALGPHLYSNFLRKIFETSTAPTENHKILVDINYRGIITTNYDRILETAYTLQWQTTPRIFSWTDAATLGSILYDNEFFIFKLHGDIKNTDSIILTQRDYDEVMFRHPYIRTFLQAIFLTNSLFFVGYSISDPDFDAITTEIRLIFSGATPLSYALLPNASDAMIQHYMNHRNIMIIPYDPHDNHIEVTQILEMIRQKTS